MAPKGEDGSWLRNGSEERKRSESISVRISNMGAEGVFKPQQGGGAGESDGEGEDYNGCFPRGRKDYSDAANLKGAPFARLAAHQDAESVKERVLGAICCCCGQARDTGEVGALKLKSSGDSKQEAAVSSGWEDDDHLGSADCCKAPYWKQLARRAKAHVHVRQAHPPRGDWLNYDPQSYQMNFDDGCRLEDCVSSLYIDENDDSASRERAMQTALLKKFAASRAQRGS